jgi:Fe-S cluster biogenesis protein NfuA
MKTPFNKLTIEKQIKLINKALETDVLPMLMSHGGGLEIMDIDGWKVSVRYYGACHGCPLADTGTLDFIEQTLQGAIDERIRVVSA